MKPENTVWYMQYIIVSLPVHICTIIGPMYFIFCILGLFNITYVQKQILVVQSMNIWQSTKDGLNWLSNELTFSFLALSAGLSVHMDRSLRSGPALTRKVRAVSPMFWPIQSGNSIIHASRFGWPSDWVWIKRDVIVHF